ncbi:MULTISPECIES: N-6 DNA methylase [unclassified Streptomyces]|uniref:N-6 DNA methylase n=1 Tax=unclassified Streptomyces TaxID=2593676 RepID=UPI000DACFC83|nr:MULTISPECIES: N-6 DNA methylase [unclassified Streptomyces]PZT78127.1 SAM-dependent methyltransferase [Streptomyces sp. AC1-42W]PZT80495.1 SAM-dependent methyltransferase [Streptomyces sp. AC1-42T]
MPDTVKPSPSQPAGASSALVTGAEIARLAGVTRAAVSNWRRRYEDFPPAVGGSASSPLFVWNAVQKWLEGRDKSQEVSLEVQTWQALRAAFGDATVAAVAAATEYLAGDAVREAVDRPAGPDGPPLLDPPGVPLRSLLDRLAEDAGRVEAVDALVARLTDSARRSGSDLVTSPRIVRAVAHFAPDLRGGQTVFDPACGVGTLLFDLRPARGLIRLGQDSDEDCVRIARARAVLTGQEDIRIAHGDALRADRFSGLAADLVVCDPPVAVTDWGREELLLDHRWEFGTPSRAEGELAWLQHAYAHTAPGGHLLVVMPASVAYRKAGRRIRAELVRRGVIRQIVALPGGVASSHALPVHLWLLRRPDDRGARPDTITMVDLTSNDPDGVLVPDQGQTSAVPLIDLLDDDVDLTPASHMPVVRRDMVAEYERARAELTATLSVLEASLPDLRAGGGADLWDGATVSVADLARAGLVDIEGGVVRATGEQIDPDYLQGFLGSGPNVRRSVSQSGTYRPDPKSARIPQREPVVQRRYGSAFRALGEAEAQAARLAETVRRMAQAAREGLGSGALEPGEGQQGDAGTG